MPTIMSTIRKRLVVPLGVLAAAFMALAIAPTPASAATNPLEACPQGYFCVWSDVNYTGAMGKFKSDNNDWRKFPQAACPSKTWNDCASSMFNRTDKVVDVYDWVNHNAGGKKVYLFPGQHTSDLRVWGFNDLATSNRFRSVPANMDACPSGSFCMWEHEDFNGKMGKLGSSHTNLHNLGWGDRASSVWNRSSKIVRIYRDTNYQGKSQGQGPDYVTLLPGQSINRLANQGFDDKTSSVKFG